MKPSTSIITDWRVRDETELPDVPPGEEFERVITPQKHVVLQRILIHDLHLMRLHIGIIEFPFQLMSTEGSLRTYRPVMVRQLGRFDDIPIVTGMNVRMLLHNFGGTAAKPRVALLVREEAP